MDYYRFLINLINDYPYYVDFPFKRTSHMDDGPRSCFIAKTLEDAYTLGSDMEWKIDMDLEEVRKATLPVTVRESEDYGLIDYMVIDKSSNIDFSYLIPRPGCSHYINIKSHKNSLEIQYPHPKPIFHPSSLNIANYWQHDVQTCETCKLFLTECVISDNEDIRIMYEKDTKNYFSAIVCRDRSNY